MKRLLLFVSALTLSLSSYSQFAMNLDGVDDSIDFGYHNDFGITDEITVECWVRQSTVQVYPAFVSGYADSISGPDTFWHGWWLGGQDDGTVTWWMADPTVLENGTYIPSTTNIVDATWHHVAGTFVDDTARLYVDGTLEAEVEVLNWNFNVEGQILGGIDYDAEWYNGGLEDVRIWNYARSQADIDFYKDQCLTGNESGLLAYYHFEEGSGTTTEDLTPGTNDADIFGGPFWATGLYCTYCDIKESFGSEAPTACNEYVSPSGNYAYTSSGIYSDTIPNSSGCDSVITITLTLNTMDVSTTLAGGTISAVLGGATYQWIDCDAGGALIIGANTQDFTPTLNGNYAVIIDDGTCVDTSACVAVMDVGMKEYGWTKLIIYPNPTEGELNVVLPNDDVVRLEIFNLDGQKVADFDAITKLNLGVLSEGIYFIHATNAEGIVVGRERFVYSR